MCIITWWWMNTCPFVTDTVTVRSQTRCIDRSMWHIQSYIDMCIVFESISLHIFRRKLCNSCSATSVMQHWDFIVLTVLDLEFLWLFQRFKMFEILLLLTTVLPARRWASMTKWLRQRDHVPRITSSNPGAGSCGFTHICRLCYGRHLKNCVPCTGSWQQARKRPQLVWHKFQLTWTPSLHWKSGHRDSITCSTTLDNTR